MKKGDDIIISRLDKSSSEKAFIVDIYLKDYEIKSSLIENVKESKIDLELEASLVGKGPFMNAKEIRNVINEETLNPWKEEVYINRTEGLEEIVIGGVSFYTKSQIDKLIKEITFYPSDDDWFEGK